MNSVEIVAGLLESRGQWGFFDLPPVVQRAIIETCRAVIDASPADAGSCFYCFSRPAEAHDATCPVPVAKCLLEFTDD